MVISSSLCSLSENWVVCCVGGGGAGGVVERSGRVEEEGWQRSIDEDGSEGHFKLEGGEEGGWMRFCYCIICNFKIVIGWLYFPMLFFPL